MEVVVHHLNHQMMLMVEPHDDEGSLGFVGNSMTGLRAGFCNCRVVKREDLDM